MTDMPANPAILDDADLDNLSGGALTKEPEADGADTKDKPRGSIGEDFFVRRASDVLVT